jgi:hypothetical protein
MGATVLAHQGIAPKGMPGIVDTTSFGGNTFNYRALNIPTNNTSPYDFKVLKAGYTLGYQKFASLLMDDSDVLFYPEQVSIAVSDAGVKVITDWLTNSDEVDQYLYTPSSDPAHCSVGYSGTCGTGSLTSAPFVRWLHDGGAFTGSAPVELTAIKAPLKSTITGTPYQIFLTDYDDGSNIYFDSAVTRVWKAGVIKGTVRAFPIGPGGPDVTTHDCSFGGGAVPCNAWYVGDISGLGVFTPTNVFGVFATPGDDPNGVLPYSWRDRVGGGGTRGLPPPPRPSRWKKD